MKSLIITERFVSQPDWTISRVEANGVKGYHIEDEIRKVKVHGETCIDASTYNLATRYSPKFSDQFYWNESGQILIEKKDYLKIAPENRQPWVPHELIWLTNVPNFQYVLIHWGNTDDDTDGCLIVGDSLGMLNKQGAVFNSRKFYRKFYAAVYSKIKAGGQQITITTDKNLNWVSKAI